MPSINIATFTRVIRIGGDNGMIDWLTRKILFFFFNLLIRNAGSTMKNFSTLIEISKLGRIKIRRIFRRDEKIINL